MARRRSATTFNLSFLDVMSCGFGAVVLVFLLMDHAIKAESSTLDADLRSEVNLLEEDVTQGQEGLVRLRNSIGDTDFQMVQAQGLASRISTEINTLQELIESLENEALSSPARVVSLQAEVRALRQKIEELQTAQEQTKAESSRSFIGDGNRQYLTGLNLGGSHIMILLDVSASMLAPEIVNVIRLRNMEDKVKIQAAKWRRAIAMVEWLTAQLPLDSNYQIYTFNTQAMPLLEGTRGTWLPVSSREQLDQAVSKLGEVIPAQGTSLENALRATLDMSPWPDNIFLITDGLPTQGSKPPKRATINQEGRRRLFASATALLPRGIPVNIILAPMEGDPWAAAEFWKLAKASSGTLLSPSRDWP